MCGFGKRVQSCYSWRHKDFLVVEDKCWVQGRLEVQEQEPQATTHRYAGRAVRKGGRAVPNCRKEVRSQSGKFAFPWFRGLI